ncbi:hypothetical protein NLG97_g6168 [Lecanicillium saksenae]|uniref:Uncharacterized protein n=1 Tax=Lecanicillium saksenae TaxID=468837 RepID=A0ACC1QQD8_9HYPO|nr:hypothetical protein NLG97_g6168 [Lecanicillium saksenae]
MKLCRKRDDGKGARQEVVEGILLARVDVRRGVEVHQDRHRIPREVDGDARALRVGSNGGRADEVVLVDGYAREVAAEIEQRAKTVKNARLMRRRARGGSVDARTAAAARGMAEL